MSVVSFGFKHGRHYTTDLDILDKSKKRAPARKRAGAKDPKVRLLKTAEMLKFVSCQLSLKFDSAAVWVAARAAAVWPTVLAAAKVIMLL